MRYHHCDENKCCNYFKVSEEMKACLIIFNILILCKAPFSILSNQEVSLVDPSMLPKGSNKRKKLTQIPNACNQRCRIIPKFMIRKLLKGETKMQAPFQINR